MIFYRFLNDTGYLSQITTIGVPHYFRSFRLSDGSLINCQIMDTGGQEKFKSINSVYYKKADCCLLLYDISSRRSFEECREFYSKEIKNKCKENIKVLLLGNKADKEDEREVYSSEGLALATENEYIFMESSCLQNKNVAGAFESLIEMTNMEINKNKKNNIYNGEEQFDRNKNKVSLKRNKSIIIKDNCCK